MARTPQASVPRDQRISVRVTEQESAKVDRLRGKQSQADYIRRLIDEDDRRQALARGHVQGE